MLCVDVQAEAAEATAASIVGSGGVARALACDVSDPTRCAAVVAEAVDSWGGLHVLANVAGVLRSTHSHETPDADWALMIGVNLSGPFYLSRAAIPHLLETRGNIVNVASTAGMMGQAYLTAYSASKHGVIGITRSLALEYAKQGLRVNAVCPGGVDTPMTQGISFPDDIDLSLILRASLIEDFQQPDSVAGLIAWLASEEARFVNGAVVPIDAGVTAG